MTAQPKIAGEVVQLARQATGSRPSPIPLGAREPVALPLSLRAELIEAGVNPLKASELVAAIECAASCWVAWTTLLMRTRLEPVRAM